MSAEMSSETPTAMEADSEGRPAGAEEAELDEYLEDASCWKCFEDMEDEVHYLRHRGDSLARGLIAAREEIARLHEAGHRLQKAYESLHQQFREVSADTVYWQSLAEARARAAEPSKVGFVGSPSVGAPSPARVPPAARSPASVREALNFTATDSSEAAPECTSPSCLDPREALRRAAVEAAEVLQKKGATRKKKAETSPRLAKGLPTTSPSKLKGRDFETLMARTPPRRTRSEESSPSPSTPSVRSFSVSLGGAYLSRPSISGRKWGIGSSPKRCPGLGTPTRRGKVDPDFMGPRSPLMQ
mmetsp:Transcript_724/g.1944  ORF Transcript_724/g.1944 Transcript_724/m.1944 type:complete len:301 (+) Transcript_724:57-959(+)